ncbi:hypothetical protein A3860_02760 [Niastella vici]|uniref:Uncharacterized protein n=1 Tax=Niastella vici TaxID=1703345 RepID=A0A1V9G9N5_9BACT|nr:hypothetical protein [Niastella vici]OQP67292.1 hypothetical protein A3860_02760 [Niastella vici]
MKCVWGVDFNIFTFQTVERISRPLAPFSAKGVFQQVSAGWLRRLFPHNTYIRGAFVNAQQL